MPGDQARPGVPVGRGVVRLRPLPPRLPSAHGHARGPYPGRTAPVAGAPRRVRPAGGGAGRRRRGPAGAAAAARPGPGPGTGVRHPVDAQDADLAAPGLDDPRARPGLRAQGGGELPRGVHDAHLHLTELPDPGLARPRPPAGVAGGLRTGRQADRVRDAAARGHRPPPAAGQVHARPVHRRADPGRVPAVGAGPAAVRWAGQHGEGVGNRRVRAGPVAGQPVHRPDRDRWRDVQARAADGQVRHPDQQDLTQHRAVHDQHRHDAQLGGLPHRGPGQDRPRPGGGPGGDEPGAAGRARPRGAEADQPVRAAAGLQRFPPGFPRPCGRHARGRRAPGVLPVLRRDQLRVPAGRRRRPAAGGRPAGGVGDLRHPLPPRLPGPGARPAVQPPDPGVHAQPGHPRGARLRPAGRVPRLHGQGARDRPGGARLSGASCRAPVPQVTMRRMSLVGIDIGSSAVKAAAYDSGGALLAQATEAVPSLHPGPGRSEVDGDAVWKAVVAVVQRVTADERVLHDPPAALAVSASGREGFPARADGSALGPCLRTADARRPETDAAVTLKRSSERWIRDCGHVPDHMDPTNRILWWAEQAPRTMSRARWFLGWHELVSLRLAGRPVVDTPLASVRPRAAAEMGLPRRCTLVAGSWDGSCAAVGAGVVEEGGALLAAGTWESVVAPLSRPRPREVAKARLALTLQPSMPGWGLWARSPNGTSVLEWALGVSGIRLGRLEAALAAAGPDPSPALMIPHLSGAPGPWPASPDAAGAVFGLTLATTGTDLVRAALEGIAIDLALAIGALRAGGSQVQTCTVAGGGARSPWWMQLKADLLGIPVEVCEQAEPGTLGAALLAGVGSGVYGSLPEAAAHARIARRFEPDERRAARYDSKVAAHRRRAAQLLAGPGGR